MVEATATDKPLAEETGELMSGFFVSEDEHSLNTQIYQSDPTLAVPVTGSTKVDLLAFMFGDEEYAIDILTILEIIKMPIVTKVPRVPDYVLGIISLRGMVVPVVDLRHLMSLERSDIGPSTRVLVLRAGDEPIGILVDRVTSVVRLDRENIESKPQTMEGASSDIFKGVGRHEGRMMILVDADEVIDTVESAL